jgi:hypothetical protein
MGRHCPNNLPDFTFFSHRQAVCLPDIGDMGFEHDLEKLQTFRTRPCFKTKACPGRRARYSDADAQAG